MHVVEMPDVMRDHWWWRPGWRVGRSFYTWHFTFEGQPLMHSLRSHYLPALEALPGLDPVALSGLHLTTQGVGFTDEVDKRDIERITTRARQHCAEIAPFDVTVGPAHVEPETVKMLVQPAERIIDVRIALRTAIGDVWGEERIPESMEGFRPHVTLAYSNSNGPSLGVVNAIAKLTPKSEQLKISTVSLIDLNRDNKRYEWSHIATIKLGS